MREAFEETGLSDLTLDCFIGEHKRDMSDFGLNEVHHRHFYHLRYDGHPAATWRHEESDPYEGSELAPIIFEFYWASLPYDVPPLIADHDKMLPQLLKRLSLKSV